MVKQEVKILCPHCGSDKVTTHGTMNGKPRYNCNNQDCKHKTFYAQYTNKAWDPAVRKAVLGWAADGAGTRATARQLGIHRDSVTSILKKRKVARIGKYRVFERTSIG